MDWGAIKQAADVMKPVTGGFSHAKRGIVTMPDGTKLFVKLAVDSKTAEWIVLELRAYHWLKEHGYRHMPELVAEGKDGFALRDLSAWDWSDTWQATKIDAALEALADLTALSDAARTSYSGSEARLGGNPWLDVPAAADAYAAFVGPDLLRQVTAALGNPALRSEYTDLADSEPWRGQDLVHYDARADNFAYNVADGRGALVDWNWMALGDAAFDRTALLVNVQLTGFDVLPAYRPQLDKASLVWLMGFWLRSATGPQDTEGLRRLRPRQVANAMVAHDLVTRL